ncbi:carboxypeptidase regulatory-like domain-containing protein [Nocardioides marmoriginsengisoli]|uniref:Carboxypeptidase regulatory-like domain-containing protein n=1 Tax=Nocardioides marmoriginsengisoli TaxID=661483 RepID=A0A3N0CFP5_9ACTN|nr:carboxypeptidase-like regulatory domain-containing protein [Nocardioides marmoriginsengisoli]RNL62119.1 carboxypeptidase regulatory-like domain-containing protein [Nocardioides marmoriginsengisoli]
MRSRLCTALLAVAAMVVASFAVTADPARAAGGTGSITGTVTVPDGYDLRTVRVLATRTDDPNQTSAVSAWTDATGAYQLTGLGTGDYYVGFGTYRTDLDLCSGHDYWWSGAGQAPTGTCVRIAASQPVITGAQSISVVDGAATALGAVPVLSEQPTYQLSGHLVAPSGESVAGMKVELWVNDETYWRNDVSGGWYRLDSVPTRTVSADGSFAFQLIAPRWSVKSALRLVDAGHGYAFSQSTGGLSQSTAGRAGADFGTGSVGLLALPWWNYPDTDLGALQLKHEIGYASGTATIGGSPEWGRTLTAHSNVVWSQPGVGTEYRWVRGGEVLDVTGPTYVLNSDDDGWEQTFSVRAVPKGAWAYNGTPIQSAPVTVVNTTPLNVALPKIAGAPVVGGTLTATTGAWRPTYPTYTYSYRWLRANSTIPGANQASYRVTKADVGRRLSVEVSANRPSGCDLCTPWFQGPGVVVSSATAPASWPAMPASWVRTWSAKTGAASARIGRRVAVTRTLFSTTAHGLRAGYQWYVGGKAVKGATTTRLKVRKSWLRKTVVLRVTVTAPGYLPRARAISFGKARRAG